MSEQTKQKAKFQAAMDQLLSNIGDTTAEILSAALGRPIGIVIHVHDLEFGGVASTTNMTHAAFLEFTAWQALELAAGRAEIDVVKKESEH